MKGLAITIRPDQAERERRRDDPPPGAAPFPPRGRASGRGPVGRDGANVKAGPALSGPFALGEKLGVADLGHGSPMGSPGTTSC